MRTHPVFLCLEGRPCVVVGGDDAAEGRALALLQAGGGVTVIAATMTPGLEALAAAGRIRAVPRSYRVGDLAGASLVYSSARDAAVVADLRAEAARERALLNVMDLPDACTFVSPAVVERGGLKIAIGTDGASPGLAAALRREMEGRYGPEYAVLVAILGAARRQLVGRPERPDVLARLLESPLLDLVRARDVAGIDRVLVAEAGADCTLARLGVRIEETP